MTQKKLKYLSIGHCCHDKMDDSFVLGGTASYSSLLATKLNTDAILLTSFGNDFLFEQEFLANDIVVTNVPSIHTTVFDNKYQGGARTQTILSRAETIGAQHFTSVQQEPDIIHLSPIADEVDFDLLSRFNEDALTLATPQGWLRQWDDKGTVSYKELDWNLLSDIDFVIISDEDVNDLDEKLPTIKAVIKNLIVTKGEGGSVVYANKVEAHFPAYPSKIVDPTGAGDTFATSFITRYSETKELVDSMIFANCLASICIEHNGTSFFEHIPEVESRMKFYKENLLNLNSDDPPRLKP